MNITGPMVRKERERRGWTQSHLGNLIGGTQNKVTRIEASAIVRPKWIAPLDEAFGGNGWRIPAPEVPAIAPSRREVTAAEWHLKEFDRMRAEISLLRDEITNVREYVEVVHGLKRGKLRKI